MVIHTAKAAYRGREGSLKAVLWQQWHQLKISIKIDAARFRSHQLVSFILMEKEGLFEWSSDVGVSGNPLEIGGCKFGELVFRQIFMLVIG